MEAKAKHDFTNNCLRIEILQKLILEDLEKGSRPSREHLGDYLQFLDEQKVFAKSMLENQSH